MLQLCAFFDSYLTIMTHHTKASHVHQMQQTAALTDIWEDHFGLLKRRPDHD